MKALNNHDISLEIVDSCTRYYHLLLVSLYFVRGSWYCHIISLYFVRGSWYCHTESSTQAEHADIL